MRTDMATGRHCRVPGRSARCGWPTIGCRFSASGADARAAPKAGWLPFRAGPGHGTVADMNKTLITTLACVGLFAAHAATAAADSSVSRSSDGAPVYFGDSQKGEILL